MAKEEEEGPSIHVEQVDHEPGNRSGAWRVTWNVRNVGREPLKFVDSSLPHGRFRGQRADLTALDPVEPGASQELCLPVVFEEPHGGIVENAFLILTVVLREVQWRLLVRMTVEADTSGSPVARTELITTQKVGFSTR